MKTYTLADLSINDATNKAWALSWARLLARETPSDNVYPAYSLEDEEWYGLLEMTARSDGSDTYYFPWEAVAFKILSDPNYALSISEDGYSGSFRDPEGLAFHLRSFAQRHIHLYPAAVRSSLGSPKFSARF